MPARLVSPGRPRSAALAGLAALLLAAAQACTLPASAPDSKAERGNPLRGDPQRIAAGAAAYAQSCARCHGEDATRPGPAADLRLIGRYCGRLDDPGLKQRCLLDADAWFLKSVEEGKVRLGIRHMPAWKRQLSTELIWSIQAYVESRRK